MQLKKLVARIVWNHLVLSNAHEQKLYNYFPKPADCRKIDAVDELEAHRDWNRKKREKLTDLFFFSVKKCSNLAYS